MKTRGHNRPAGNGYVATGDRYRGDGVTLRCLWCESVRTGVAETRSHQGTIRRIRKCKACGQTFMTKEVYCDVDLNLVEI